MWAQLSLAPPAWLPLTIDEPSTGGTLLVNVALVVLFLIASDCASSRPAASGIVARGVALMLGLLLSLIALAQDSTSNGLMYWRWRPLTEGAPPFGPFVNRNHFATWMVLAIAAVPRLPRGARRRAPGDRPKRR